MMVLKSLEGSMRILINIDGLLLLGVFGVFIIGWNGLVYYVFWFTYLYSDQFEFNLYSVNTFGTTGVYLSYLILLSSKKYQ